LALRSGTTRPWMKLVSQSFALAESGRALQQILGHNSVKAVIEVRA
jgi:hypothetical protein